MKCFYHGRRNAVGQCPKCSKGLCKDCITEHNGICEDCYFDNKAQSIDQNHDDILIALTNYKKSIIKALVMGGIFGVLLEVLLISFIPTNSSDLFGLILFFFMPSGYMTISRIIGKDPNSATNNTIALFGLGSYNEAAQGFAIGYFLMKIILFVIKLVISIFIGIPCVIYLVVKLVITNKQLKQLDDDYKNVVDDFVDEMKKSKKK